MAERFVLRESGDQYFFNLKAEGNHEVILTSERYTAKVSAILGIEGGGERTRNWTSGSTDECLQWENITSCCAEATTRCLEPVSEPSPLRHSLDEPLRGCA